MMKNLLMTAGVALICGVIGAAGYLYFAIRQRIANPFPPAHRLAFVASDRQRIA
jgi:hypothetical protein